MVADMFDEHID